MLILLNFACSEKTQTQKDEVEYVKESAEVAEKSRKIESKEISFQKDTFKVEAGKVFFQKYPSDFGWIAFKKQCQTMTGVK
ncbi:MAG: hypothetical protein J7604_11215 [Sporocytophaga sp.]|uniref:hypothetical protein n=1 Tax=Sporocytophaga sp. TaxID=2231183 RepID=UPI001B285537|nr:hypothetical protein [Sporocytophaga sp.]MBO9700769.1 hypothetical protein [Sporocytophaga sp.]